MAPSPVLSRFSALFTVSAALLSGCAWVPPETRSAATREWQTFADYDWIGSTKSLTGFGEAFPSATERERVAAREDCLHSNSENRIITQDGVADSLAYRRCVLAPYPQGKTAPGLRMGSRPEPQS